MREKGPPPYQRQLGEVGELEKYRFPKGTMIWPENSGRGTLTEGCWAEKLPCKIKNLTGFESCGPLSLYWGGKYWKLPNGTRFGAYSRNAKKIKLG